MNCLGALNTETSFPPFLSKPRYKTNYYGMLIRALIGHRLLSKSHYPNLVKDYHIWKRTFSDPVGAKFISGIAQTLLDWVKKLLSSASNSFLSVKTTYFFLWKMEKMLGSVEKYKQSRIYSGERPRSSKESREIYMSGHSSRRTQRRQECPRY